MGKEPPHYPGQNFLINKKASQNIVETFQPNRGETIVEIGPGKGALTENLIESQAQIYAIEIDESLCTFLRNKFRDARTLTVLHGNILNYGFKDILAMAKKKSQKLRIIGNIPYQISKPLLFKLISERASIHDFTLMLQKEVAERILSKPGSKTYSPLSVLLALTAQGKKVMELSPRSFSPTPKVYSTVISCVFFKKAKFKDEEERLLKKTVAALFSRRRKTIKNNLAASFQISDKAVSHFLEECGVPPLMRAEELNPDDFLKIMRGLIHLENWQENRIS